MKLSIIIVNYNVKYFLEQCLHSVLQAISSVEAEVIVIDNASSDESVDYLQPLFPSVMFIASKKNLGFGKANNLALSQAKGEYVLFLNPDTIVSEECFTKCLSFFEQNQKAGAVGVRMLDGSGKFLPESKRSFPTTSTAFFKAVGLSDLFPASPYFNKYSLGYLSKTANHPVDVLCGAFMMVRSSVLKQTGGFDEAFFMYAEDIDLSYRLKQTGYENWYLSDPLIIHFKGESVKKWSSAHVKMFYTGMIIFVKKHYKGKGAALLRLMLTVGIKTKGAFSLIKGRLIKNKNKTLTNLNNVIVGDKSDFDKCSQILNLESNQLYRAEFSLTNLASPFDEFCSVNKINQIIFCNSTIPYSAALKLMLDFKTKYSYRFHATGSNSIVGSDSKADLGEIISLR